ncbi:MAG: hypothetical protein KJ600_05680 [Nanoarchaeota archaeon]|nr:hypothetical protein [Nanoarchaeota archaeon]MBU1104019.1 hypothetical protein [Nanoarchaeota archaeon]
MKRLQFGPDGKLVGVDGRFADFSEEKKAVKKFSRSFVKLKTSSDLDFLKEAKKIDNIFDKDYWSLYENDKALAPLKFSNGKTQEDIVKEVVSLIKDGRKVIFLHGVCGTGKSAIALNIARSLGSASIVVPIKSLQKQYEKDYMGEKYVVKENGEKMKIAMITGRENHDSIIEPGKSCGWPFLPDTIKITEKNANKLKEYYEDNPFVSGDVPPSLRRLRRISIAPTNPYWSPILPIEIELKQLSDARKRKYVGMNDREFVFYHRKQGCSYYDQYLAYFEADVIIFNSAKYLAEVALGRKPRTDVEIIDEADEFLDKFSNSVELNLTRLASALKIIVPDHENAEYSIEKILKLIDLEEKNKRALGVDENEVSHINQTKIEEMLKLFLSDLELEAEIEIDEMNYANSAVEAARDFHESFKDTYLTYKKEDDNLIVRLVTTDLSKKFREIVDGNKAVVLMSGTLHSDKVLKHIFGIEDFARVDAETLNQGTIEICRTGREFDCRYSNLKSRGNSREEYLVALSEAVEKSKKPSLVHVNAFHDLPREDEIFKMNVFNLVSGEKLRSSQGRDNSGEAIVEFKAGKKDILFTTKCSRGIDFPGDMCRSVIFTKYPNPSVQDTFWKILKETHSEYYWEFYKDRARRDFLQRIYRAVRSKDDHVYVLSPDSRVLEAVRELQLQGVG